jgi:hypothetical protein
LTEASNWLASMTDVLDEDEDDTFLKAAGFAKYSLEEVAKKNLLEPGNPLFKPIGESRVRQIAKLCFGPNFHARDGIDHHDLQVLQRFHAAKLRADSVRKKQSRKKETEPTNAQQRGKITKITGKRKKIGKKSGV